MRRPASRRNFGLGAGRTMRGIGELDSRDRSGERNLRRASGGRKRLVRPSCLTHETGEKQIWYCGTYRGNRCEGSCICETGEEEKMYRAAADGQFSKNDGTPCFI